MFKLTKIKLDPPNFAFKSLRLVKLLKIGRIKKRLLITLNIIFLFTRISENHRSTQTYCCTNEILIIVPVRLIKFKLYYII